MIFDKKQVFFTLSSLNLLRSLKYTKTAVNIYENGNKAMVNISQSLKLNY